MKILAIIKLHENVKSESLGDYFSEHLEKTWALHKSPIVRQIEMLASEPGTVVHFECDSIEIAKVEVEALPLMRAGLLSAQFISLKPYDGWEKLFLKQGDHNGKTEKP